MTQHTKGEWHLNDKAGAHKNRVDDANGDLICMVGTKRPMEEDAANARLIAAAPKLLAELIAKEAWLIDYVPATVEGYEAELNAIRTAIAAVKGE
jgi:hypothetical protein